MGDQKEDVPPLTEAEVQYIRSIIEQDKRVDWFWRTIRVWATWLAAVITGFMLSWDTLVKFVQHAVGSGK